MDKFDLKIKVAIKQLHKHFVKLALTLILWDDDVVKFLDLNFEKNMFFLNFLCIWKFKHF